MASLFEPLSPPPSTAGGAVPEWIGADPVANGFVVDRRYGAPGRRSTDADPAQSASDVREADIAAALAEGERIGRAAAEEEFAAEKAAWNTLKLGLSTLDQEMQKMLAERLRETVAALCERTLEPMALDRAALVRRCENAARLMGETAGQFSLHLHPEDHASLDPEFAAQWAAKSDPALERGSVRLSGPEGNVFDGPAEWRTAIADAIGLDNGRG